MKAQRQNRRPYKPAYSSAAPAPPAHLANRPTWGKRVYAICFDLDIDTLRRLYHNTSYENGYKDIARVLARHGFHRQQGSVYFGDDKVDPVRCVLAIQDVTKECPWFAAAVADVRMLRIEENNDLRPAVGDPTLPLSGGGPIEAEVGITVE